MVCARCTWENVGFGGGGGVQAGGLRRCELRAEMIFSLAGFEITDICQTHFRKTFFFLLASIGQKTTCFLASNVEFTRRFEHMMLGTTMVPQGEAN